MPGCEPALRRCPGRIPRRSTGWAVAPRQDAVAADPSARGQQNWPSLPAGRRGTAAAGARAAPASALQQPPACAGSAPCPRRRGRQRPPAMPAGELSCGRAQHRASWRDRGAGGGCGGSSPRAHGGRSWTRLHHHSVPNALRLLSGSFMETRGQGGEAEPPGPRAPQWPHMAGAGSSPRGVLAAGTAVPCVTDSAVMRSDGLRQEPGARGWRVAQAAGRPSVAGAHAWACGGAVHGRSGSLGWGVMQSQK